MTMTTKSPFLRLDQKIANGERGDVMNRWAYGRELLKAKAGRKQLPHGMIAGLVATAAQAKIKLSEREIQYRIRCATVYDSEAKVRKAAADFGTWTEIISAGFPEVTVDEEPSIDAVLDAIETGPRPDAQEHEQLRMFPEIVKSVPLASATLRHLVAYAEEMRSMTASFARRDEERREHLRALTAATGGDLDVTYPEAIAALHAAEALTSQES
jgi:hypothetical protein